MTSRTSRGSVPKTLEDIRKDVSISGATAAARPAATTAAPAKAAVPTSACKGCGTREAGDSRSTRKGS